MDSVVSSITYAYYRWSLENNLDGGLGDNHHFDILPVINIPEERLNLRTETLYLLQKRRIDPSLLIFRNEIHLNRLHEQGKLHITLVDHNVLEGKNEALGDAVVGVIDHHKDEGQYLFAETRIIESTGSCTTLIAREILNSCLRILDKNLAKILLAAIVLDTSNLDDTLGRPGIAIDKQIASSLMDIIQPKEYPQHQYRSNYFKELLEAKYDIENISSKDLLRRDYKEWVSNGIRYGISSVTVSLDEWVKKDTHLISLFLKRMRKKLLDLLVVMLMSYSSTLSRELIILTDQERLGEAIIQSLSASDLKLTSLKSSFETKAKIKDLCMLPSLEPNSTLGYLKKTTALYVFNQKNNLFSRKSLQPLLHQIFSKYSYENPEMENKVSERINFVCE